MPESDLLLTRHIAAALTAAWHSMHETQAATGAHDAAFLAGARTALATVALVFGIEPARVLPELTEPKR